MNQIGSHAVFILATRWHRSVSAAAMYSGDYAAIRRDRRQPSARDRGCRRDVATVELKLAGGVSPELSARCSAAADVTAAGTSSHLSSR